MDDGILLTRRSESRATMWPAMTVQDYIWGIHVVNQDGWLPTSWALASPLLPPLLPKLWSEEQHSSIQKLQTPIWALHTFLAHIRVVCVKNLLVYRMS